MRRTEIHLSEPFEEVLASVLTLPNTLAETDEVRFARTADSELRKSAKCDAKVKEALRSLYETAHGRQVETQIGFVTIAPPVARFLKDAPYYVTTRYEFFLEAFTRVLAGASPRKDRTNGDKTDHMAMHKGAALKKLIQKKPSADVKTIIRRSMLCRYTKLN
jgi:hypothetical protein